MEKPQVTERPRIGRFDGNGTEEIESSLLVGIEQQRNRVTDPIVRPNIVILVVDVSYVSLSTVLFIYH